MTSHADLKRLATDRDHRIIDCVSVALGGNAGQDDDIERVRMAIEKGDAPDKLKTACEALIAFLRWAQDIKAERRAIEMDQASLLERIARYEQLLKRAERSLKTFDVVFAAEVTNDIHAALASPEQEQP